MVVAPTSTIDPETPHGASIQIETRSAEEVTRFNGQAVTPPGVTAWNPVFDVTPATLVDLLVTERGVCQPPDGSAIAALTARP